MAGTRRGRPSPTDSPRPTPHGKDELKRTLEKVTATTSWTSRRRARWPRCWPSSRDRWPSTSPCRRGSASWPARPWRPEQVPAGTRLVMEKPFGSSEESARELNKTLAALVPEDHIHRVDHFLGKATVLNILGLRFANNFLEPVWNREHIEKVEIIFDEDLALEGRARYYDGAGALRDMIQSHLLQIMALLAIEPPATIGRARPPRRRGRPCCAPAASSRPVRQEHAPGPLHGGHASAAGTSPTTPRRTGVDPARAPRPWPRSQVEIDNWRWKDVPFILRSGKALGEQAQGGRGHLPAGPAPAHGVHRAWTRPTSSGSVSARTPWSSTSTSTAPVTSSAWTGATLAGRAQRLRPAALRRSAGGRPDRRSAAVRRATPPRNAGGSSSRC